MRATRPGVAADATPRRSSRRPALAAVLGAVLGAVAVGLVMTLADAIAGRPAAAQGAQEAAGWPDRPISFVSGFPPGAATDTYSRKLGALLSERLKVPVITDNRTGAGGNIASGIVAQARPDGHTFLLGTAGTHAINASLYNNLGFDVVADFTPIALLGDLPNVLLINPAKHPDVRSCADLLALARARPGALNYASTGNGTSGHLGGVQFATASRIETVHVPYRGQGPAMTGLLSSEVDFFFNQTPPSIPMIQSGKVRALAVTSARRVAAIADVPTVAEACRLPGFTSTTWYALFGPKGLPDAIRRQMTERVLEITRSDDFRRWLDEQGISPIVEADAEALRRKQQEDIRRWAEVVKASGAKID
jgi:tripartite-type tricarboxylate transporter receptor subunit TctC